MKKVGLLSAALVLSTAAFASANGFYAGALAGYGTTHYTPANQGFTSADIDHTGMASRFYFGYQQDQHLSVEIAYLHLPQAKFTGVNGTTNSGKISLSALELTGHVLIVTSPVFHFAAALGLARMHPSTDSYLSTTGTSMLSDKVTTLTYGFGASYDISPTVSLEANWQRYHHRKYFPGADVFMAGVAYHFG